MKTSSILIIGAAALLAYTILKKPSGDSVGMPSSPSGFLGNPINIYTTGYNPNQIQTSAPPNTAVTNTNPHVSTSTQTSGRTTTTSKSTAKIINDVFSAPKTLNNAQGVPYGTAEDIATAQNFARGLVGTPNALGGFNYKF